MQKQFFNYLTSVKTLAFAAVAISHKWGIVADLRGAEMRHKFKEIRCNQRKTSTF